MAARIAWWAAPDLDPELLLWLDPEAEPPELVLGSDVVYSEEAVGDLLATLTRLAGPRTTVLLAGELRNDVVVECFLEAAMAEFEIGCIEQEQWHPDFRTNRVAIFILLKKKTPPPLPGGVAPEVRAAAACSAGKAGPRPSDEGALRPSCRRPPRAH
ncbi:hypothetical protein TRIUR3_22231 [Triticum urartu]|uniref:Nicotinamide N-methyltransferase n=1 Tax=Triticum urartu TaxID=4572 RepID=M7YP51_TRIUA|nr:hypothetical protein TRIUR3_22231 [Triticum urartu]